MSVEDKARINSQNASGQRAAVVLAPERNVCYGLSVVGQGRQLRRCLWEASRRDEGRSSANVCLPMAGLADDRSCVGDRAGCWRISVTRRMALCIKNGH